MAIQNDDPENKSWSVPPPPKPNIEPEALAKRAGKIATELEKPVDPTPFKPNWLNEPWEPYVPDKIVSFRDPINFCSLGGYRWFSSYWWKDLLSYPFYDFWRDCKTFYLRGRYGWAPRDTWNLESHLARTLAGTLNHLADHTHGVPATYPTGKTLPQDVATEGVYDSAFILWQKDLRRWAKTFDDYYDWHMNGRELAYNVREKKGMNALLRKEKEITNNITKTFREIGPWFRALWD